MSIDYSALAIPKGASRFSEKQRRRAEEARVLRELRIYVYERDNFCCRACKRFVNPSAVGMLNRPHLHHVVYRSLGGQHVKEETCLLCAACHADLHDAKLRISGDPEVRDQAGKLCGLVVERADEAGWRVVRRG